MDLKKKTSGNASGNASAGSRRNQTHLIVRFILISLCFLNKKIRNNFVSNIAFNNLVTDIKLNFRYKKMELSCVFDDKKEKCFNVGTCVLIRIWTCCGCWVTNRNGQSHSNMFFLPSQFILFGWIVQRTRRRWPFRSFPSRNLRWTICGRAALERPAGQIRSSRRVSGRRARRWGLVRPSAGSWPAGKFRTKFSPFYCPPVCGRPGRKGKDWRVPGRPCGRRAGPGGRCGRARRSMGDGLAELGGWNRAGQLRQLVPLAGQHRLWLGWTRRSPPTGSVRQRWPGR